MSAAPPFGTLIPFGENSWSRGLPSPYYNEVSSALKSALHVVLLRMAVVPFDKSVQRCNSYSARRKPVCRGSGRKADAPFLLEP